MDIFENLKLSIERYTTLKDDEWQDFVSRWQMHHFSRGEVVTRAGDVEHYFYHVYEGVLRGFQLNNGHDYSFGFSYNGDFSGVFDSFLDQSEATWNLEALKKSIVLRIHYRDMMEMFDRYKSVERWGRLFNADMLIRMAKRQLEVRSYTAEEKFNRLYDNSPHMMKLVSQKHLSSYIGVSPETFSRLRKQRKEMELENLI